MAVKCAKCNCLATFVVPLDENGVCRACAERLAEQTGPALISIPRQKKTDEPATGEAATLLEIRDLLRAVKGWVSFFSVAAVAAVIINIITSL